MLCLGRLLRRDLNDFRNRALGIGRATRADKRNRSFRRIALAFVAMTSIVSSHPLDAATVVNTFNDWTLYSDTTAQTICFLAARPTTSVPTDMQRDESLFYISAWPTDGVKAEVSVKLGVPAKKASDPTVSITGQTSANFKLFAKDDRAFVQDTTQELKLLDAMKKGSKLTVQSTSDRGTSLTDTYSLQGITAALQALQAGCR
jgi:invasion protein IalB